MTTDAVRRRLEFLERAQRRAAIRPIAERIAAEDGIPVADLVAGAEWIANRAAAIGMDACLEEIAATDDIPIEELRAMIGRR